MWTSKVVYPEKKSQRGGENREKKLSRIPFGPVCVLSNLAMGTHEKRFKVGDKFIRERAIRKLISKKVIKPLSTLSGCSLPSPGFSTLTELKQYIAEIALNLPVYPPSGKTQVAVLEIVLSEIEKIFLTLFGENFQISKIASGHSGQKQQGPLGNASQVNHP